MNKRGKTIRGRLVRALARGARMRHVKRLGAKLSRYPWFAFEIEVIAALTSMAVWVVEMDARGKRDRAIARLGI